MCSLPTLEIEDDILNFEEGEDDKISVTLSETDDYYLLDEFGLSPAAAVDTPKPSVDTVTGPTPLVDGKDNSPKSSCEKPKPKPKIIKLNSTTERRFSSFWPVLPKPNKWKRKQMKKKKRQMFGGKTEECYITGKNRLPMIFSKPSLHTVGSPAIPAVKAPVTTSRVDGNTVVPTAVQTNTVVGNSNTILLSTLRTGTIGSSSTLLPNAIGTVPLFGQHNKLLRVTAGVSKFNLNHLASKSCSNNGFNLSHLKN